MLALRAGSLAVLALAAVAACADNDPLRRDIAPTELALDRDGGAGANGRDDGDSGRQKISVIDDCNPTDPGWAPTGGCALKEGSVSFAEFNALVQSPLVAATVGHPAWRNQPSYLQSREDRTITVTNIGGRLHTFTPVAQFGGGRVPPLNFGMVPAPECQLAAGAVDPNSLPPGNSLRLDDLAPGIHRFQCCIHPWMRALIRVTEHEHGGM
jgi:hypothetical protein